MNDKNFQISAEKEAKERRKKIWIQIGLMAVALGLAIITVFVLYLNR